MRCASILFVASVIGETICKFNGIRRKRNIREIETDFSKDSDPNAMNVFLLRIEGDKSKFLSWKSYQNIVSLFTPKFLTSKFMNSNNDDAKRFTNVWRINKFLGSSLTRLSGFTSDKLQIVFDENENYETLVTVENPVETQYLVSKVEQNKW